MVSNPFPLLVGVASKRATHSDIKRTSMGIANEHPTAILYFGHTSELSASNGFPIHPKTSIFFNKGFGDQPELEFWLVSDTADTPVKMMEFFQEGV